MSVNAISGSSSASSDWFASIQQQQQQSLSQLSQSLQSGNLSAAQSAFALLMQSTPQLGQAQTSGQPGQSSSGSQMQADMRSLAQALQSGDLSAAKKAFAAVQQDMKTGHKGHRRHGGPQLGGTNDPMPTIDPTTTAQTAGSLSITV